MRVLQATYTLKTVPEGTSRCECAEGKPFFGEKAGRELTPPPVHDCEYIRRRNTLIPEAKRMARRGTAKEPKQTYEDRFSREFLAAMQALAEEVGV